MQHELEVISQGWVDHPRVPGGIQFDPTLQWAASQSYLFWLNRELYTEIRTDPVYRFPSDDSDTSNQINLEGFQSDDSPPSSTSLHAEDEKCDNEDWYDGCSGLHWLNDSHLRPCCDTHDHCYRPPNDHTAECTWRSWFVFFQQWRCIKCNVKVVACFVSQSLYNKGHPCSEHEDNSGSGSDSGADSDSGSGDNR